MSCGSGATVNRAQTVYQYDHVAPSSHGDAMRLERINGDNKWFLSEQTEVDQLMEYEACHKDSNMPP